MYLNDYDIFLVFFKFRIAHSVIHVVVMDLKLRKKWDSSP